MENTATVPPDFLASLLEARSPSGYETEAQAVFDRYVEPCAAQYRRDALGNRIAILNPNGSPTLMLAGHIDELGLLITYVDKDGFLYFETIGGHDLNLIAGRRVVILTNNGPIPGVTGKRAVHLLDPEERKKAPERQNLWIDIGVKKKEEALALVRIGDPVVYDQSFAMVRGSTAVARAFDNKAGAYVVGETLRRLSKQSGLSARVVAAATVQEEIGCRGARASAFSIEPDFGVAVDVGHATDHPECDNRKFGEFKLGGGPILTRGANVNPRLFDRLMACAADLKIPCQLEADPRPTGTDGREIQWSRAGVATAVVSIPLRYMHTPSEMADLQDIEQAIQLLTALALSLRPGDNGIW